MPFVKMVSLVLFFDVGMIEGYSSEQLLSESRAEAEAYVLFPDCAA